MLAGPVTMAEGMEPGPGKASLTAPQILLGCLQDSLHPEVLHLGSSEPS